MKITFTREAIAAHLADVQSMEHDTQDTCTYYLHMTEIKNLRIASGMTQQAFADFFTIPKRTIENWEGQQRRCPDYLLRLMEYKLQKEGKIKTGD